MATFADSNYRPCGTTPIEKGADFNMSNASDLTPLITASEKGFHVTHALFDWEQKSGMKLDVDARDQYGATALIKAAEGNHVAVMQLLLNHGVSVNLHDYHGFTAIGLTCISSARSFVKKLDCLDYFINIGGCGEQTTPYESYWN